MKDIMGLLVGSLFVVFVLISLLSGVRSQNSGLVTSHGKISDSEPFTGNDIAPAVQHRLALSGGRWRRHGLIKISNFLVVYGSRPTTKGNTGRRVCSNCDQLQRADYRSGDADVTTTTHE